MEDWKKKISDRFLDFGSRICLVELVLIKIWDFDLNRNALSIKR